MPHLKRFLLLHCGLLGLILSSPLGASLPQDSGYLRDHYEKKDYMIPMRDGVKLFTIVYAPKDTSQKYPIMLFRTPYSIAPYGSSDTPPGLALRPNSIATATFSCSRMSAENSDPKGNSW